MTANRKPLVSPADIDYESDSQATDFLDSSSEELESIDCRFEEDDVDAALATYEDYAEARSAAQQCFQEAQKSSSQKDYASSTQEYEDAITILEEIPDTAWMLEDYRLLNTCSYHLGNSLSQIKEFKNAISAYDKASLHLETLKSMNAIIGEDYLYWKAKYYLNIAICYSNMDDKTSDYYYARARDFLADLRYKFPSSENENSLMLLASCYYGRGEYAKTTVTLDKITSPSDKIHDAYYRLIAWCENKMAVGNLNSDRVEHHLKSTIKAMQQIKLPTKDDLECLQIDINNLGELRNALRNTEKDLTEHLEAKLSKNKFTVFKPFAKYSVFEEVAKKDAEDVMKQKNRK